VLDSDVSILFSCGKGIWANKPARQLRNICIHNLSIEDKAEIISKATFFMTKLEKSYVVKLL